MQQVMRLIAKVSISHLLQLWKAMQWQPILYGVTPKKPDYTEMPSSVFTLPTLAAVGMTEAQAKKSGLEYQVKDGSASSWYNAKRINESTYAYKIISDKEGYILGAHIIGPHAEEMINLFAMAIKAKLKVPDIRDMVYSYPSMGSDIGSMV